MRSQHFNIVIWSPWPRIFGPKGSVMMRRSFLNTFKKVYQGQQTWQCLYFAIASFQRKNPSMSHNHNNSQMRTIQSRKQFLTRCPCAKPKRIVVFVENHVLGWELGPHLPVLEFVVAALHILRPRQRIVVSRKNFRTRPGKVERCIAETWLQSSPLQPWQHFFSNCCYDAKCVSIFAFWNAMLVKKTHYHKCYLLYCFSISLWKVKIAPRIKCMSNHMTAKCFSCKHATIVPRSTPSRFHFILKRPLLMRMLHQRRPELSGSFRIVVWFFEVSLLVETSGVVPANSRNPSPEEARLQFQSASMQLQMQLAKHERRM